MHLFAVVAEASDSELHLSSAHRIRTSCTLAGSRAADGVVSETSVHARCRSGIGVVRSPQDRLESARWPTSDRRPQVVHECAAVGWRGAPSGNSRRAQQRRPASADGGRKFTLWQSSSPRRYRRRRPDLLLREILDEKENREIRPGVHDVDHVNARGADTADGSAGVDHRPARPW